VLVSEFNYQLPPELIAQEPLSDRAASRLLRIHRFKRSLRDDTFRDFPEMLRAGDLLLLNNTRVFPARLYGSRSGTRSQPVSSRNPAARDFLKGQIEVLLTRQVSQAPNEWECLVRPGRKIKIGERLFFGNELEAEVIARGSFGERRIRFAPVDNFFGVVERLGHIPLPPYINRSDLPGDWERYQTVYAQASGSVAAPTAGLHFTPEILARIRGRGIETAEITLHVGLGTFQPVRVDRVEDHRLHTEPYEISTATAEAINRALDAGRRLVAVGTTTVRTLEYAASQSGDRGVKAGSGEADLFIYPGYQFRVVSALLTNFHLPQSSLLMLVCAFGGFEPVMQAYRHAVEQKYRFYSYGDCMFIE
jgi:S-adenosylmethionine:tRNA ribosyltransferase-isomerase